MINEKRLINTFLSLIKIDSISLSEGKIIRFLKRELDRLGFKTFIDNAGKKVGGETGNLIGFLKGEAKSTILLNAHVDTVSTGIGIKPKIKNKVISSSGKTILGADNKAGVSVILEVLRVIKEKKIPHCNIEVVFTVCEEIGLLGAKALSKRYLSADYGIALDGGDVDIVYNRAPSQKNIYAKIIGKAAHAGVHPEKGINAIKVASFAISKMRIGRIDSQTTANIGIIKGGVATNIVPDEVEIKGEARSHRMSKLNRQIKHMKEALINACSKFKAKLKLKITDEYKSFFVDENHKIMRVVKDAAKKIGLGLKVKSTGGGSDANIFNKMGIKTIILGVGAQNVHTNKEKIKINDMVKGANLLLEILRIYNE